MCAGPPSATRTALVADTTPPAVVTQTRADPTAVLTGLSGITAGGGRQTVAALELAVAQLPREPDNPRLVVLYTGGARTEDAPEALAAALRADGAAPTATPPVPSATARQYPSSAVVTTASTTPSARSAAARASGASSVRAPPV